MAMRHYFRKFHKKERLVTLVSGRKGVVWMNDSILLSVKKLLGLDAGYDAFDLDVIIAINAALFTLNQLGLGPDGGFKVTGVSETWHDFLGDWVDLEAAKEYVYMKSRLAFDPPTNPSVLQALKDSCNEYEFRLNVQVDPRI